MEAHAVLHLTVLIVPETDDHEDNTDTLWGSTSLQFDINVREQVQVDCQVFALI